MEAREDDGREEKERRETKRKLPATRTPLSTLSPPQNARLGASDSIPRDFRTRTTLCAFSRKHGGEEWGQPGSTCT